MKAPQRWKPRGDGGVDVLSNALKSDQLIFLLCLWPCKTFVSENAHARARTHRVTKSCFASVFHHHDIGLLCPQGRLTGVVLPDEQSSAVCLLKKIQQIV